MPEDARVVVDHARVVAEYARIVAEYALVVAENARVVRDVAHDDSLFARINIDVAREDDHHARDVLHFENDVLVDADVDIDHARVVRDLVTVIGDLERALGDFVCILIVVRWSDRLRASRTHRRGGEPMFIVIPTGLIRGLIAEAVGGPEAVRGERAPDADQIAAQRTAAMVDVRAREVLWACTGPDACLVVLGDNDWSACWFDGVRLAPEQGAAPAAPRGGYRDGGLHLGPGPHGVAAVCAGRHVIVAGASGKRAVQHLTLHPREACFLRLDPSGAFGHYEPAVEQVLLARLHELAFVSYAEHVAGRRIAAMIAKSAHEATAECMRELQGLLHAVVARDAKSTQDRTARAIDALVGAPLPSFEPLTTFVGFHTFELLRKNKGEEAWTLVTSGLTILPEEPTLLAIAGELLLAAGDREGGLRTLRRALEREAAMDAKLRDRVRGLLASA